MTSPRNNPEFGTDEFQNEAAVRELAAMPGFIVLSARRLEIGDSEKLDSPYFLEKIIEVEIDGRNVKYIVSYIQDNNETK